MIAGSGVASGSTNIAHWPIPPVWTGRKCREVQGHDIPDGHTQIRDVGGGGGMAVHSQGDNAPRASEKSDPLTRI